MAIVSRTVAHKEFMLARDERTGENVRVPLTPERAQSPVLSDDEVRAIAALARKDEDHYGAPQDAEWAIENGTLYLVQTRPITTIAERTRTANAPGPVLVRGLGVGPGSVSGRVRVLTSPDDSGVLQPGEILVAAMTSPD